MSRRVPEMAARVGRPLRRIWRNRAARRWEPRPPDFVGVGAQRCGTTWWWRLICDHPRVQVTTEKEVHFFDRYFAQEFTDADAATYRKLFAREGEAITGEWTPRYMHDFWTPGLLARAAPDARILILLRDPLGRYQSGLSHEVDALRRGVRRNRRQYVGAMSANDALSRSLYGRQLRLVLEHFDASRILVLQYERCVASPRDELRRTFEFLGADPVGYVPSFLSERRGSSHPQVEPTGAVAAAAHEAIVRDVEDLKGMIPELDLDVWPSCSGLDEKVR